MGRPTKYKEEYNEQAYELCLLGYTNEELAVFFEVSLSTFKEWRNKFPKFSAAVKAGKEVADAKVAKSLFKRACGYQYDETTKEGAAGNMKVTKIVTKEVAPDAGAALNWLKNRQKDKWRDKRDIEHSGGVNVEIEIIRSEGKNKS